MAQPQEFLDWIDTVSFGQNLFISDSSFVQFLVRFRFDFFFQKENIIE